MEKIGWLFLNWVFNGEIGLGNDFRMGSLDAIVFWGDLVGIY